MGNACKTQTVGDELLTNEEEVIIEDSEIRFTNIHFQPFLEHLDNVESEIFQVQYKFILFNIRQMQILKVLINLSV